ncbi:MAG: hypothetical protein IKP95_10070 [Ruminococcus sp.]|nr:hypothetical protein [Ruminococcus sp.]
MEAIKAAIFTACTAGLISCIVKSAAIGAGGKRIMRITVNMIVLLALVKPLMNADFTDVLNDHQASQLDISEEVFTEDLNRYYIASAELSTKNEVDKFLREKGYYSLRTVIICEIDEYDQIEIKRAELTFSAGTDIEAVRGIVSGLLPDAELQIAEAADEQTDNQHQEAVQ